MCVTNLKKFSEYKKLLNSSSTKQSVPLAVSSNISNALLDDKECIQLVEKNTSLETDAMNPDNKSTVKFLYSNFEVLSPQSDEEDVSSGKTEPDQQIKQENADEEESSELHFEEILINNVNLKEEVVDIEPEDPDVLAWHIHEDVESPHLIDPLTVQRGKTV